MLEELIKEGQEIRSTISFIQPHDGVMRLYSAYRIPNTQNTAHGKTDQFVFWI